MQIPKQVLVTDVVARDGFQNEDRIVSTEDLVHMLHEMDIETGIDLDVLLAEGRKLRAIIGHELASQVARAATSFIDEYPAKENQLCHSILRLRRS